MKKVGLNITVIIYTYDRIVDAKINIALIRKLWQADDFFKQVKIIHSYDGEKSWYPKKYLEDNLVVIKNPGHFEGAANLMDEGFKQCKKIYPKTDYVIFLASDTWLTKPDYVKNILYNMTEKKLYLATCAWNIIHMPSIRDAGMATDFFIVDFQWVSKYKMFPIAYKNFYEKFGELLLYVKGSNLSVEKLAFTRYLQAIFREYNVNNQLRKMATDKMYYLKEREPIHENINKYKDNPMYDFWDRKMNWPELGLYTGHDLKEKEVIFKDIKNKEVLQEIKKLFKK